MLKPGNWSFTFCLVLYTALALQAQDIKLTGKIVDGHSQEPLVAATIQFSGGGTLSDADGSFQLDLKTGHYQFDVRYVGYDNLKLDLDLTRDTNVLIEMVLAENLLQTAVVTTSRYARPLSESTISLDVIKPDMVQRNSPSSVEELLGKVPGVTIVGDQANIRGGSGFSYGAGSRVLLLLNDMPALQTDAGYPNWNDIPVETLGQIEVVKGASSALYGSSALNGIIHFQTTYPGSEPETKISAYYTHYFAPRDPAKKWWDSAPHAWNLEFSHKEKIGKLDLVLGGFLTNGSSFAQGSGRHYGRGEIQTRYRISDRATLSLGAYLNKGRTSSFFYWKDAEAGAYQPTEGTESESKRFRYYIDPQFTYFAKKGGRHRIQGRILGIDNNVSGGKSNASVNIFTEYQYSKDLPDWDANVTGGLVYNRSTVNAELYGDSTFVGQNASIYAQFSKKIDDRLTLSGGWRYEYFVLKGPSQLGDYSFPGGKEIQDKPVWRVGANWQLLDFTFLRASWGQGFRFPSIAEKFIQTSFGTTLITPNPTLKSESGWSSEIGIKQGIQVGGWRGFLDASAFWSQYQDMMEFVFTGFIRGFQSQNIGNTDIKGFEISLAGEAKLWGIPMSILAGYTYIDPRFQEFTELDSQRSSVDYNILKYRSKNQFTMDWQWTFHRLKVGTSTLYLSKMEAIDSIFELVIPGVKSFRETHGGFQVWDARLSYDIRPVTVSLILRNAFNAEYASRPGQLDAPRNLLVRADWKF
ncbi:MAG TPA: TonB-dependent receptor [Saprospiraceae bacterium]|nr:TonB-dependent receptor [Saprospiraceae bacterium]HPG06196.1 TonB-dependent receptor [Saprospiraceae bacterium]HPQ98668.1 TonB-dependent receptor [Saprospiraceae bacterium]HRV85126.1 TonB-dependent receptor [Saprospiraceae bacterium]